MRNAANTPVYRQAETISPGVLAKLIDADGSEQIERVHYGFMAWISDQVDRLDSWQEAWKRFDAERRMTWK